MRDFFDFRDSIGNRSGKTELAVVNTKADFDHRIDGQFHTYAKAINAITEEGTYLAIFLHHHCCGRAARTNDDSRKDDQW